jgi:hypothetical protein
VGKIARKTWGDLICCAVGDFAHPTMRRRRNRSHHRLAIHRRRFAEAPEISFFPISLTTVMCCW